MSTSAHPAAGPVDPAGADETAVKVEESQPWRPSLPARSDSGLTGAVKLALDEHANDLLDAAHPPLLEGYQITSRLGAGGMGTVWRAWQLSTRREVALKLLKFGGMASERAKQRFDREVEVTSRLQHPHIARVYDSGIHQGVYYYAMELIEGVPLDTYVHQQGMDRLGILNLMIVICRAVQHAHQRGVIHRDLKPSNILIDAAGEPHVVDFGLGKAVETGGDSGSHLVGTDGAAPPTLLTIEGEWAGTPLYMSPEQAAGKVDQLDTRTDVYSLGVMLYQLLTGHFPHDPSGGSVKVLQRLVEEDVIRPRRASSNIDAELDALLLKALSRNPDDRYLSAGTLADDLENYLRGEPLSARAPTAFYFMRKKLRKHRLSLATAAAALVGLISLGVYGSVRVAHERDVEAARARSESELRALAELRHADTLASWGDLLASDGQWDEAAPKFADARALSESHGVAPVAAALGLLDVYEHAPSSPLAEIPPPAAPQTTAAGPVRPAVAFAHDADNLVWVDVDGAMHRRALPHGALPSTAPPAGAAVATAHLPRGAKRVVRVVVPSGRADAAGPPAPAAVGEAASARPATPLLELADVATGVALARVPLRGSTAIAEQPVSPDGLSVADICSLAPERGNDSPHQLLVYRFVPDGGGGEVSVCVLDEGPHLAGLDALAFSHDGKRLVAGGAGVRVAAWDVDSGKPASELPSLRVEKVGRAFDIRRIASGPADGTLALASQSGAVALWRTGGHADAVLLAPGGPGRAGVGQVVFSPDGRQLAAADEAGDVRVWDVATGEPTHAIAAHSAGGAAHAAFSPDGQLLATAGADRHVRLWAVRQQLGGRALRVQPGGGFATCLALSPDGRLAASGHTNRVVDVVDVATGRLLRTWTVQWPLASVAFTADGTTVLSGTSQSSVFALPLAGGLDAAPGGFVQQPPRPLPGPPGPDRLNPGANVFSPNGAQSIHFSIRGAGLWDVAAGRALRVLDPRPTNAACFRSTAHGIVEGGRGGAGRRVGALIAVTDGIYELVAFDLQGDRMRAINLPVRARVTSIAISHDGRLAVIGDQAGALHALDLVQWAWRWDSAAHADAVRCLAFAPDGRTLLSGGDDGVLRLIDAASGRALRVVGRGSAAVQFALFSADGRRIVATVGDGRTIRTWDMALPASFDRDARTALAIGTRLSRATPTEQLVLAEWYLHHGQPRWAAAALAGQKVPRGANLTAAQVSFARVQWAAGKSSAASEAFATALGDGPTTGDATYLALCRDAAAGGAR